MERRSSISRSVLFLATLLNFFTIYSVEIGEYNPEETLEKTANTKSTKASRKTIELSSSMLSYGSILRIKNEDSDIFLSVEENKIGGAEDPTLETYWYIQPEDTANAVIKKKHVIPNGATINLINVVNGKKLAGQSWILQPQKTIESYCTKDQVFVLKDPEATKYLTASLDVIEDTELYELNTRKKLSTASKWTISEFYPAMVERELKNKDVVAIKCLANDKYLTPMQKIEINAERRNQPDDVVVFENIVAPLLEKPEAKFKIVRKKGYVGFESLSDWAEGYFLQSNSNKDQGWDRKLFWQQKVYHYMRGLFRIWSKEMGNLERFRIEWPYIKDVSSKGYITYLWESIGLYLKSLKDRGRSVFNNKGVFINTPILSAYDNIYFATGKPNKRSPKALFVFEKLKGSPIMPIIPEEEKEEEYGIATVEAEIKIDKALKGKVIDWQNISEPGMVEVVFDAKAIDNIMLLFAPEKKDYKKDEMVEELVIGGGLGKNSNTYSLIRNTHFGKASDPKTGTFKMGKHIPNRNWNTYWVKIIGNKKSFGMGKDVGENIILEWDDPEEIAANFFGFSNYKNPVYLKNVKVSTPEVTPEIKAKFFENKLKRIRKKKTFKGKVDGYLSLLSQASESDGNRDVFINEIVWLSENTPKDKTADLQQLINSCRYTPSLINEDPLRDAILSFLAIQSGVKVRFSKKIDALDNLLNLAYSQVDAKEFLTKHSDNIALQIRVIAEESLDESQGAQNRVKVIIDTAKSDPIFSEHATTLSTLLEEIESPLTVEALQERVDMQTATRTEAAEKRFMKTVKKIVGDEIKNLKKELAIGQLSDESRTTRKHIKYLLRSIQFGLKFNPKSKAQARKLLEKLPGAAATEIVIEPAGEDASIEEKITYIIAATNNKTLKSSKGKKPYFETLSQLVSEKNVLTPEQVEKIRLTLGIIKWHKNINDQEKALIKYYLSQLEVPVTLDDKVNQLLKEVLLIKQDQEADKKLFFGKVDDIIKSAETKIEKKEKVESLKKLKRLLKTVSKLPQFASEKDSVEIKLAKVKDLIKKQEGVTEKKKEEAKKQEAKKTEKVLTKARTSRRAPATRRNVRRSQRRVVAR